MVDWLVKRAAEKMNNLTVPIPEALSDNKTAIFQLDNEEEFHICSTARRGTVRDCRMPQQLWMALRRAV